MGHLGGLAGRRASEERGPALRGGKSRIMLFTIMIQENAFGHQYPGVAPRTGTSYGKKVMRLGLLLAGVLMVSPGVLAAERPLAHAIRVSDGQLVVDGRDEDWQRISAAQDRYTTAANDAQHVDFSFPERGKFSGPDDLSMRVRAAVDSENFYLLADVHDQILTNTAPPNDLYAGDDFEVFIDASPVQSRFGKAMGENVRQLIFLPAYVNPRFDRAVVWQAEKCPGVKAVSRLRPWGYTLEIKIPKALFPNWKAHPDLDSIGFDVCVNDADSPGFDPPHAAMKDAMFLLQPAAHFMSPEKLGVMDFGREVFGATTAPSTAPVAMAPQALIDQLKVATPENAEALAQEVLDAIADGRAAEIAAAAVGSSQTAIRKAGLVGLAKRPQLDAPIQVLKTIVEPEPRAGYGDVPNADLRSYALVALAARHQLPAGSLFGYYARVSSPELRLTFVWCLGANADRTMAADLAKLLYDGNIRVRMMAALSLGELGDASCLGALEEMAQHDPHHYGRQQAEAIIKQIKEVTKP